MATDDGTHLDFQPALDGFERCRQYRGDVAGFWTSFAEALRALPDCSVARILTRSDAGWKVLAVQPPGRGATHSMTQEDFELLRSEAEAEAFAERRLAGAAGYLVLFQLQSEQADLKLFAELLFPDALLCERATLAGLFGVAASLPRSYERNLRERRMEQQLDDFSRALEVLATVNARREFTPAAMALVNEVADRFEATRATLGWVENYYVKVVAMSGTDRIERKVEVVQRLEAAMEECRDQEEEITYPNTMGGELIRRSHEAYLQESHVGAILSVPLRVDGEVCAVLTLEREQGAFQAEEAMGLRVIADQTAPGLSELRERSRWFGKRWADAGRRILAKAVGPRHTWMKVGAVALSLFLGFALFFPYTYRAKANFQIVPDSLALLPVPFQGYIEAVHYRPGDVVDEDAILFEMDDGELRVERARALADLRRYRAEAEQAEAAGEMGEYRISIELAGQAQARLQLADYRLDRAEIKAPFDGVLVEGDLRNRLGAPVDQGEVMVKFSRLDGLYVEIELEERDIDLLDGSGRGQIAFASRPDLKFPIEIIKIEPSAQTGQGSNFFVIRAEIVEAQADWLRPGMTGVAKLDSGQRTLAWRATHRLVDFLRMFFWF
jgi:hypothetical protein